MIPALLLGGTKSGCGKTSAALGLMRALARRGLCVAPFKSGPDFIDPGLHGRAARRPSHNLDTWMLPAASLRGVFARGAQGADVVVAEGAMGLFDGRGAGGGGSSAELARMLDLPVALVVDAAGMGRSVAALALGYAGFDPGLRLAGVLLNRVASPRHEEILRAALAQAGVPVLGCLPRREGVGLASRHLGLVAEGDIQDLEARLEALADWVEEGVDIPALLSALPKISIPDADAGEAYTGEAYTGEAVRIGVARDRAFCFVYEENLRLLSHFGGEPVFFSPLADARLPEGIGGLYLPGGYPELAAPRLAANASLRAEIAAFCASGRPVWAECGGYMYLLAELADAAGRVWPMCGALPGRAAMRRQRAALGYREARTLAPGPLGPAGTCLRGHEFHYSEIRGPAPERPAFALTAADGGEGVDGQALGNVVGGYFHAHLASNPEAARAFVGACRD
jgi:cobyrinic acid a,c-diamide synthase